MMLTRTDQTTSEGIRIQKTVFINERKKKEIHLLLSLKNFAEDEFFSQFITLLSACEEQAMQEQATIVFQRFMVSNAKTQQSTILHAIQAKPIRAVSIVEQPPTDGSKVALWAYLSTDTIMEETPEGLIIAKHDGYMQAWATRLTASGIDSQAQTEGIFRHYIAQLLLNKMTIEAHCQRTWIFVDDIDNNYTGMVLARNNVFESEGLSCNSHFIASTGIAGSGAVEGSFVMMDAVAYDLPKDKVHYLYAQSHLNRTSEYGVRFERGTMLDLPNATQVFISGTASINNQGEIVFGNNILRQAERMMSNVEALLAEAHCSISDCQQALVYLREPIDSTRVEEWMNSHYPTLPYLILHAPICRTGWLIEMECMAMR